ncbi:TRAP transporter substrate-binding protein DctP [Bacteriovorax sp. PP10]|uniref:TRAP transporter substrate-binding protein DctP n=1 Tax=Bacteriovorax antarcticus TaxID=3088717 RepID=A0ABU5VXT2_9BACT|nr:TRAP transporter substrate-binding protein DctP [Bacteriovorax sp. PP10]MEA9357134.1 TRAP transporter substrate-binding protein DctP [Bacteriovorax sp. PP10]
MKTILLSLTMLASLNLHAAVKVGVLAPEGTGWAKNIKKMASEIKDATKGNVEFKIYYGGSQGDEQDVLRKIRIGQLQGGIFTGKTLGEINGDVRVIEIPFTFNHNREKALRTLQAMEPFFDQKFAEKKFKSLATFEIGQVYFVTQKKVTDLNGIKNLKIWSWDGDPIVTNMFESMNLTGVPLALPDVLASLSTGIIDAAYAPPIGMIALQWNTKVKYMIDFPVSYSIGAFVITSDAWAKVSPADQKLTMEIAKKYEKEINLGNAKDNEDALAAMKAQKIEFVKFSDAEIKVAQGYRNAMVKKLTGKLFTPDALKKLEAEIAKK